MNRFVKAGSRLLLVTMWVFVAALFADSANLDDLFASNDVIHDDQAICSAPSSSTTHDPSPTDTQPGNKPGTGQRVVIDQDSPSTAATEDAFTLVSVVLSSVHHPAIYRSGMKAGKLHIKYRVLLI